ncbi:YciI family protein [Burkholderia sp. S171]|uniref:YciI family protein n=1 Tax=Burkholderia sp. S171 TaxID=1641860 RepID=UPI00131BC47A|nr:YciI family protein [Burkholderia sp. S171]
MPYLITCRYVPGGAERRLDMRDVHIEYILRHKVLITLAGAIVNSDGTANGMFLTLGVESESAADAFVRDEPYNRAGLFETVSVDLLKQFIPHPNENFLIEELEREKIRLRTVNDPLR